MSKADKKERRWAKNIIKNQNENPKKVKELMQWVIDSGGIEYTQKAMFEYRDKALDILKGLPQNEYSQSLEGLVHYTINRKK